MAWRVLSLESSYKHYVHVTSIEVFKTLTHSFENGAVGYGYIWSKQTLPTHVATHAYHIERFFIIAF